MISVIQRVRHAKVEVDGAIVGQIEAGILALVAVEKGDSEKQAKRLVERILGYRIFADGEGKMNLSLTDTGGSLLLVSQFTLAADTRKGSRPSFTPAAPPEEGKRLFDFVVAEARKLHQSPVETGEFGADMQVSLINDGPVTFTLQVSPTI